MKEYACTHAIVVKGNRILLGLGVKKGGFGEGRYNGFGGKVEAGESVEKAAFRELHEECGIVAIDLTKVGVIEYDEFFKGERSFVTVHVYIVTSFAGEPAASNEMQPKWFDKGAIPYDQMFGDDKFWLPLVLSGKKIKGFFRFDEKFNILEHRVEEVKEII